MPEHTFPLVIYYDAACRLCNSEMTNLMLRNTAQRLQFVDVSAPGFNNPPPGATREDLLRVIHAQRADGVVIQGVDVFRLAYRAVGLGAVSRLIELPVLRTLADRCYPWLARHRYRIPAWISHFLFETAMRRAARRAASAHCSLDGACRG